MHCLKRFSANTIANIRFYPSFNYTVSFGGWIMDALWDEGICGQVDVLHVCVSLPLNIFKPLVNSFINHLNGFTRFFFAASDGLVIGCLRFHFFLLIVNVFFP